MSATQAVPLVSFYPSTILFLRSEYDLQSAVVWFPVISSNQYGQSSAIGGNQRPYQSSSQNTSAPVNDAQPVKNTVTADPGQQRFLADLKMKGARWVAKTNLKILLRQKIIQPSARQAFKSDSRLAWNWYCLWIKWLIECQPFLSLSVPNFDDQYIVL